MYAVKSGDTLIELGFDNAQTTLADRKRLFYQLGVQKLYLPETELIQELLDGVEMKKISLHSRPGQGARTPHALWPKKPQNIKQKQYCNKF